MPMFGEHGLNRAQKSFVVSELPGKFFAEHGTNRIVLAQQRQEVIEKGIDTGNVRCCMVGDYVLFQINNLGIGYFFAGGLYQTEYTECRKDKSQYNVTDCSTYVVAVTE